CCLALWAGCQKTETPPETPVEFAAGTGVFISNEGGFTHGNASVSFYRRDSATIQNHLFENKNGRPLGDVLQSMTLAGGHLFLVVNNSGKIEVVEPETFASVATISGLTSPRYLRPVSDQKAYVTDLAAPYLSIIDLQNFAVIGQIPLPAQTEELVTTGGETWVTHRLSNFLYVIDNQSDMVVDSVEVAEDPNTLRVDKDGNIWVLCNGRQAAGKPGGIFKIEPATRSVLRAFWFNDFETGIWPRLRMNGAGDVVYFIKKDVYRMPVTATEWPAAPFIVAGERTFYGLGIDPATEEVYVADALDYQQKGLVYRFSGGIAVDSFRVGVIPNGFLFY
ncbi:MAG: YncE family protein, partial [Bacteroidetes bacterium]